MCPDTLNDAGRIHAGEPGGPFDPETRLEFGAFPQGLPGHPSWWASAETEVAYISSASVARPMARRVRIARFPADACCSLKT